MIAELDTMIELLNCDCMEYMATVPDKYFDLAVVDPPYGMDRKMDGTSGAGRVMRKWKREGMQCWDVAPTQHYWIELFRISKNQIVWGANNFLPHLPPTTNYVFWDKHQPVDNFADGELAWTSFKGVCKKLDLPYFGAHGQDVGGKQHPTQKPIKLYQWLLTNYAKKGQRILDTHLGSGSSAIAAHYFGVSEFVGCELDKDYFDAAKARFDMATKQLAMSI
ncbi:MAG TPA: DNA methyltransferase [Methylotenera sp.]|nr:DNA methyltransferase [Methylotenera sp.]